MNKFAEANIARSRARKNYIIENYKRPERKQFGLYLPVDIVEHVKAYAEEKRMEFDTNHYETERKRLGSMFDADNPELHAKDF